MDTATTNNISESTYIESVPAIFQWLSEAELIKHIRTYYGYLSIRIGTLFSAKSLPSWEEYVDILVKWQTYPEDVKPKVIQFFEENERLAYFAWQKYIAEFIDKRIARKEFDALMKKIK